MCVLTCDVQAHLLLPPPAARDCPTLPHTLHAFGKDWAGRHVHRNCLPTNIDILPDGAQPALLQHILRLRVDPLIPRSPAWLVQFCHSIGSADVEPLQPSQGCWREDPRLAAIEQHGLHHGLVELCSHARGGVLAPKNLPDTRPCRPSLPQLGTDSLDVIVIQSIVSSRFQEPNYLSALNNTITWNFSDVIWPTTNYSSSSEESLSSSMGLFYKPPPPAAGNHTS